MFEYIFIKFSNIIWLVLLVILVFTSIYFSYLINFIQITKLFSMIKSFSKKLYKKDSKNNNSLIKSIDSLIIVSAGRIGIGNISGVAYAISIGGPGVIVWMWIVSLLGCSIIIFESIIGQLYKSKNTRNEYIGGPFFYIQKGLGYKKLANIIALCMLFSGFIFSGLHSNQIYSSISKNLNGEYINNKYIIFSGMSLIYLLILLNNKEGIIKILKSIMPISIITYMFITLFIVTKNYKIIPEVFYNIFYSAFNINDSNQFIGCVTYTMLYGARRGIFSSDIGNGSCSMISASKSSKNPISQAYIQVIGVIIDTIIVCSMTAFIILFTQTYKNSNLNDIQLVQASVSKEIPYISKYIIQIFIIIFGVTSIVTNYLYNNMKLDFLLDNIKYNSQKLQNIHKYIFILFISISSIFRFDILLKISDIMQVFIILINLIALNLLRKKITRYII